MSETEQPGSPPPAPTHDEVTTAPKAVAEGPSDKPKLELSGRAAVAVGGDPVVDQYRRRLSMTVLS